LGFQICGQPEKEKPPHAIRHKFTKRERPGLFVSQQIKPFYFTGILDKLILFVVIIGIDVGQLRC
jgi:hypothetical protein